MRYGIDAIHVFSRAGCVVECAPHGYVFKERQVPVMTLTEVCAQYVRQPIDFLSIDAELHEREVLEGQDWRRWRARIVVIEDGVSTETGRTSHDQWEHYLLQADYRFAFFDGVNRFYVRKEDEALLPLLQVPVNSTDNYITAERVLVDQRIGPALWLPRAGTAQLSHRVQAAQPGQAPSADVRRGETPGAFRLSGTASIACFLRPGVPRVLYPRV